jgi:hypothetical protein
MATNEKPGKEKAKGPGGRPCKLTPEVQQKICDLIQAGNYDYIAAQAAGISVDTFYLWKREGEEAIRAGKEDNYFKFLKAIKNAEAKREAASVARVVADPSWQATMTYLERRYPERWSKRDRTDVSGTLTIRYEDAE